MQSEGNFLHRKHASFSAFVPQSTLHCGIDTYSLCIIHLWRRGINSKAEEIIMKQRAMLMRFVCILRFKFSQV